VHALKGTIYHALAKERTKLLRCESLEPPMSQLGQRTLSKWRLRRASASLISHQSLRLVIIVFEIGAASANARRAAT
jgi:hypothetical protein